jgi:hypothetical protein
VLFDGFFPKFLPIFFPMRIIGQKKLNLNFTAIDHFDTEGYYHPPSSSSTNINFGQVDSLLGGHGTGDYYNNPSSSSTNINFGQVDLPQGGHGTGDYYNNPSSSTNINFGQVYLPLGGSDRMCHCENTISYGYKCPRCLFHSNIYI